jgi:type II secretory pathway component PulC
MPAVAALATALPPPPVSAEAVPLSTSGLQLRGTIALSDPAAGLALLGPSIQSSRIYAAGSEIGPGTVLKEVYPNHVIIQRSGTLEMLPLLDRAEMFAAAPRAPATHSPFMARRAISARAAPLIAQPVPHADRGVDALGTSPRAALARIGLRASDVLTQINGVAADSDPGGALARLVNSGSDAATITVMRRGAPVQLSVKVLPSVNGLPPQLVDMDRAPPGR